MKRLFLLSIIFILCFSFSMFANIDEMQPAICNTTSGKTYTQSQFDAAAIEANSGDTFELGLYSDTEGWELNQAEGYSGLYQKYNYLNPNITKNSKGCIIELYFITELNLRFGKINYYADDEITYLNSSFYAVKE